jgi:hypothetical protein
MMRHVDGFIGSLGYFLRFWEEGQLGRRIGNSLLNSFAQIKQDIYKMTARTDNFSAYSASSINL